MSVPQLIQPGQATITTLEVQFPPEYKPDRYMTKSFRGAICALDPNNPFLCQRDSDGNYIYRYPLVHYRWDLETSTGLVVGFNEGAECLLNLQVAGKTLLLNDDEVPVVGVSIQTSALEFSESETLRRYRLRSPWLPFNAQAYTNFHNCHRDEQQAMLDRLARNHLVSAMRDLNHSPGFRVQTVVNVEEASPVLYKDSTLFGVFGTIVCNVNLPEHFAFGRKVSYGFGWVQPVGG